MTIFTTLPSCSRPGIERRCRLLPLSVIVVISAVAASAVAANSTGESRSVPAARGQAQSQANGRPSKTIVDHAVQPAGGGCRQCGTGGCKTCRSAAHRHHRDCRDGHCVASCPVRPHTYGFYETQWRRWPGEGVVPVSNEQAATPVVPPKSEVPSADEESRGPKPSELPQPQDDAAADNAGGPRSGPDDAMSPPQAPEPDAAPAEPAEPAMEREPQDLAPEPPARTPEPAAPRGVEKPAPQPEAAPPKPSSEDDNLFDESAARKVRRKIPVGSDPQPSRRQAQDRVQQVVHEGDENASAPPAAAKGRRAVPRVPFDPKAETARLRNGR